MYTALLIDTLSIQQYIFGSNKLKENIGGSYIIENLVYREMIPQALLANGLTLTIPIDFWKSDPGIYRLRQYNTEKVEIGFIGGGNAFVIFREKWDALRFIKSYSKKLLQYFPGLKTAYGFHEGFDYQQGDDYGKFMRELNSNLLRNRNYSAATTIPFKHGIVQDCPWTNEAQEIKNPIDGSNISAMAYSRINLVDDANKKLRSKFSGQLGTEFSFTDNTEKFGQPDDKGYIAVVHADGNGIGKKFIEECTSLIETRTLSAGVAKYADGVMVKLIDYIVKLFEKEGLLCEWKSNLLKENGKKVLPIRPLIIGGDDITFVCDGRLGVNLAEKLLEFMSTTPINNTKIAACAGVAIVHTHYPFYKTYLLAEELTERAKIVSRDNNDSWLEYMISSGGFSGSLDDIIDNQYKIIERNDNNGGQVRKLKYGPYKIDGDNPTMQDLKSGMKTFNNWPRSKVKDVRDALRRDDAYQKYFLTEIKARGLELPNNTDNGLWLNNRSPYYDMIELLDFYPQELLI